MEHWLPSLHNNIKLNIQLTLAKLIGAKVSEIVSANYKADLLQVPDKKDPAGISKDFLQLVSRSKGLTEQTITPAEDKPGRTYVFTYLLKTLLPLPEQWTFDACSDAVTLSLKYVTSKLIQKHLELYKEGDRKSFGNLHEKLNAIIITLSDFLLAQVKIRIHKKNIGKNPLEEYDLENLDIIASVHTDGDILEEETSVNEIDCHLQIWQVSLLRNLIHYFCNERVFIENILKEFKKGSDKMCTPMEWYFHPKYTMNEENCTMNVSIKDCCFEYEYEFQGSTKEYYVTPMHSRSLYWVVHGIKNYEFVSFATSGNVSLLQTS